jgi:ceramide glucosyltransferase
MTALIWFAGLFCAAATAIHVTSVVVAMVRCRPAGREFAPPPDAPAVTLIRPVCGIDNHIEETLRSSFALDYPRYELLFCVASPLDPACGIVERLIAQHRQARARLLVGEDCVSANPKLNNIVKGWDAAAHDWIVIADSNVLMPRDHIARLLSTLRPDTGLVCSPPVGCRPEGFWGELECAFLNGYQARWQYFSDTLGRGFAQGKTMLWRREILDAAGGIRALGAELAEDAAATKIVAQAGSRVRLVDAPFEQPLGPRRPADVWFRQVRWARLRRASFPQYFVPEVITGALFPLVAGGFAAAGAGISLPAALAALAFVWYGSEYLLVRAAHWHFAPLSPAAWVLRDLLLPILWIEAWLGREFVWRGNRMRIADESEAA